MGGRLLRAWLIAPLVSLDRIRERLDAVEELHYVANASAARLASGQSRTVGLITPMLTTWYTSELMVGVEEVLTQARFDLLIGTANPAARERIFLGDARFEQRVDGVILGCTEICLILDPENLPLEGYDSTTIHAQAAVEFALTDNNTMRAA